jgi:protein-S-isoprenylcysteine O-methyltransferase Ste14
MSPSQLLATVLFRFVLGFLVIGLLLFLPAGTLAYWEAWLYLGMIFLLMTAALVYLFKNDPQLLERRMRTREKEAAQKRIIGLALIPFLAIYLLPGLDKRFGWSQLPPFIPILADVVALAGYLLILRVFRENSYTSRVIEVEQDQPVISTGPYAIIRHPMYAGSLLLYIFSPLALGSYWAMLPALTILWVLVARIRNEEQVLCRELKGYPEYMQKVKYRLIPGVW